MQYQKIESLKEIQKNKDKNKLIEKDFYFEVLVTDTTGKVFIKNEDSFCHNLLSNNILWSKPEIKKENYIVDEEKKVRLHIKKITSKNDLTENDLKQVFVITVNGKFENLEPFRIPLLNYLKILNFDSIYVLEDHISLMIAKSIYPGIYKVESFLRKYVIKFFVIKLGPEWWNLTADSEMQKKTNLRKNNETIFSEFIDNKVYLIDFGELGKLIYSQSSGNLSKDDIVNKIMKLDDNIDALKKFKEEIQTNYNKFFKNTFKDNNFQLNWEELERIRHKVAHNNLFTLEDKNQAIKTIDDLIKTITKANEEIDDLSFSEEEKEDIVRNFTGFKTITKEIFIEELHKSVEWSKNQADGFVGLQNFLINILGPKGYEFYSTRELLTKLEKDNIVEIYSYISDKNDRPVTALKFKDNIKN